jgi:hypothetical protein
MMQPCPSVVRPLHIPSKHYNEPINGMSSQERIMKALSKCCENQTVLLMLHQTNTPSHHKLGASGSSSSRSIQRSICVLGEALACRFLHSESREYVKYVHETPSLLGAETFWEDIAAFGMPLYTIYGCRDSACRGTETETLYCIENGFF